MRNYLFSKADSGPRQKSEKEPILKIVNGFKMVVRVLESHVTLENLHYLIFTDFTADSILSETFVAKPCPKKLTQLS